MIIKNVNVFTEEKTFRSGMVIIQNDKIKDVYFDGQDISECGDEVLDGEGAYCLPGMIDLHMHGCIGYDICDGTQEALAEITAYELSAGVTAVVPATMTLPVETLKQILSNAASFREGQLAGKKGGADLLGINMEGPFISREKKGAQDEAHIIPGDTEIFYQFQKAARGLIKFIGIAPEIGQADSFIREVKNEAAVALAHTNADYETAKRAFDAGACHLVHLYNAMTPFTHREPGVIGAAADSAHVTSEIICDGVHVHPSAVRAAFSLMGDDRLIFVSDSMRAAGMPDGIYTLGGMEVNVQGNTARLVSDGALAGSVTTLPDCVRTAVKTMGIPLGTAAACATQNPAKCLGVYETYGTVLPGRKADLVFWDKELRLKKVMKNGKMMKQ